MVCAFTSTFCLAGHLSLLFGVELGVSPVLFLTGCSLSYAGTLFVLGMEYTRQMEQMKDAALEEAQRRNSYLEHAAKILRHDMHSGINTYLPRGLKSLERRLSKSESIVEELKLGPPLRMLREGLTHTQRVYASVTEFTNLVRGDGRHIERQLVDLRSILLTYLDSVAYRDQIVVDKLPRISVNVPLFCTALDNFIRNGLKYNDSHSRMVIVKMLDAEHLGIIDNGRGMTQAEFDRYSQPYSRRPEQKEKGTGLGLNIAVAIMQEHEFTVSCSKNEFGPGTTIRIKVL